MFNKGSALLSAASEMMSFSFGQPPSPTPNIIPVLRDCPSPSFFFLITQQLEKQMIQKQYQEMHNHN